MSRPCLAVSEWSRRRSAVVVVVVIAIFLWEPLIGRGSLLPADILQIAGPWASDRVSGSVPENITLSDTIDLHVHFASWAETIRSGEFTWWDRGLVGGIPALKAGFSPVLWIYLLVPAWYAPVAAAAVRSLLAAGLTYGFLRSLGTDRIAAVVGGIAFALSGYMVGWAAWPQSNVAAFAPGVMWAAELLVRDPRPRRAAPLALLVAAMIVSNFPLATAYILLAAAVYAVVRVASIHGPGLAGLFGRRLIAPAAWGVVGVGVGIALAAPHISVFGEYFEFADTSPRDRLPADTSIGTRFLLTTLLPRAYGTHHIGHEFWAADSNWVEAQGYAGAAVVGLALLALAYRRGTAGPVGHRASATRALWTIVVVGAWLSYVGGPLTEAIQSVPFFGVNSVGRARVIMNLALAGLAGLGVQALIDRQRSTPGVDFRHAAKWSAISAGVAIVAFTPWLVEWVGDLRDQGLVRETITAAMVPVAAAGVLGGGLLIARRVPTFARHLPLLALVVVAAELLVFARPVATVVDRELAEITTPAHDFVRDGLAPGERLAGEGRTFFANTGQLTGIDDARGHLLISSEWGAALRLLDPNAFRPPGSVTNPHLAADTDITSPLLDLMAVRYWSAEPATPTRGSIFLPAVTPDPEFPDPTIDWVRTDSAVLGEIEIPPGGLRGVLIYIRDIRGNEGRLNVVVTTRTDTASGWRRVDQLGPSSMVSVPLAGEHLEPGESATVEIWSTDGPAVVEVATRDGLADLGTIGARDDGLRLVYADGVVLYERAGAEVAHVAHAVIETDDPYGMLLADTARGRSVAFVEPGTATGLPTSPPANASSAITVEKVEGGSVRLSVETSHAAIVIVSQYAFPGWSAVVNGRPAAIVDANGAFSGVVVPPGTSQVELSYTPTHIKVSLVLMVLGAISAFGLWKGPQIWRTASAGRSLDLSSAERKSGERRRSRGLI